MTAARLAQLQKCLRCWLGPDHQRTQGSIPNSHQEWVRVLQRGKGNFSYGLRPLDGRGWIVIGRSAGGKAECLWLTPEGRKGLAVGRKL